MPILVSDDPDGLMAQHSKALAGLLPTGCAVVMQVQSMGLAAPADCLVDDRSPWWVLSAFLETGRSNGGRRQRGSDTVTLTKSEIPIDGTLHEGQTLLEFGLSQTTPISEKVHIFAGLTWSEAGFAQF